MRTRAVKNQNISIEPLLLSLIIKKLHSLWIPYKFKLICIYSRKLKSLRTNKDTGNLKQLTGKDQNWRCARQFNCSQDYRWHRESFIEKLRPFTVEINFLASIVNIIRNKNRIWDEIVDALIKLQMEKARAAYLAIQNRWAKIFYHHIGWFTAQNNVLWKVRAHTAKNLWHFLRLDPSEVICYHRMPRIRYISTKQEEVSKNSNCKSSMIT